MSNEKAIEKLKESNAIKDKYMLIRNDHINSKQLLHILQNTPKKYIYKRKGRGGRMFIYVKGKYIKKVLNYAFGWLWDFEVKDHGREKNQVWVLGRLTIKNKKLLPIIVKEQFGRSEVKILKNGAGNVDYGNDLKAAATDSLKKCASELGIASDVYGSEIDEPNDEDEAIYDNVAETAPKDDLTPLQRTIKDIRATKNIKTLKDWAEQIKKASIWNDNQKRTLLDNINEQIKNL